MAGLLKPWRPGYCGAAAALIACVLAACAPAAPLAPTFDLTPAGPVSTDSPEVLQAELSALPAGNADAGKALFTTAGCVACHSLQPDVRIVGPSLSGVAIRAASRKPGYSAQLYLYESITHPNAYVVDSFPSGVMPQDFKTRLKPQDLADLIAFLSAEK